MLVITKRSTKLSASLVPIRIQTAGSQNQPHLSKCAVHTVPQVILTPYMFHVNRNYKKIFRYLFIYSFIYMLLNCVLRSVTSVICECTDCICMLQPNLLVSAKQEINQTFEKKCVSFTCYLFLITKYTYFAA